MSLLNNKKYLNEADSIFNKVKDDDIQAIWENHLLLLISNKHSDSFNQSDKDLVREAIMKFPSSKKMLTAEKLINNKKDVILLANEYDQDAALLFSQKKYKKAIDNWEKAKSLIPNEDSYYLNIAQAYNGIEAFNLALSELEKIEKLQIEEKTGKLEFLRAVAYLGLEKKDKYCQYFIISSNKGYILSKETLKKLNCKLD